MLTLILKMLKAFEDFGSEIGFTKEEIDELIAKYKVLDNLDCNELGLYVLLQNDYITPEEFAKQTDCHYENGDYYLVVDDFSDILKEKEYSFEISILNGDYDLHYDYYESNIDFYYYTEDTLESIIKYCIKNKLEIEGEEMTRENTKIIDGDLYFNDTKLEDIIDEDDLEDLKIELNGATCEAQESADYGEIYNRIVKSFENEIGEFSRRMINNKEKLFIKIYQDKMFECIVQFFDGSYDEDSLGNIYSVLYEYDYFNFRTPDYNYISGSIDKKDLNDHIQNRLYVV
jgi:hypothetical protein